MKQSDFMITIFKADREDFTCHVIRFFLLKPDMRWISVPPVAWMRSGDRKKLTQLGENELCL